jgi:hypothetical protein
VKFCLRSILIVLCVSASAPVSHAQRYMQSAAHKSSEISTFGGFQFGQPGRSSFGSSAEGAMAGADFTWIQSSRLAFSLETRGNFNSGPNVTERTVLAGQRIQTRVGARLHPYADFLVGGGTILFAPGFAGYHEDRSTVISYGGGLNVDMGHHLSVRTDVQMEHWNLGTNGRSFNPVIFNPFLTTVGVEYRIPFAARWQR